MTLFLLLACADGGKDGHEPDPDERDDTGRADTSNEDDSGATSCVFAPTIAADAIAGEIPFTVHLTADTSCGELTTAAWDFGDGQEGEGSPAEHTFLGSGDFTVHLTGTNANGEDADAFMVVRVEPATCPETGEPTQIGTIANADLVEASGLAEGLVNPGVLWSHNDSGDGPRLFALDPDGTDRGTFALDGAPDGDWEDLAIGTDAGGAPVLYVGDIGSNGGTRSTATIYVVPEPTVGADPVETALTDWSSFDLVYPDGDALDANAMLWDPEGGALYLAATEGDGTTGIYRASGPFADGDAVPLERVAVFEFGGDALPGSAVATGGSSSPLGDRFVLRTADSAWLWRRDLSDDADAAWASEPCPIPVPTEESGDAIAYSADGAGYYTTGEGEAHRIDYTAIVPAEPECTSPGVGIVVSADTVGVGDEVTLSLDDTCLFAGVSAVEWDLGDGATSADLAPAYKWLASGAYVVTAHVTAGDGTELDASLAVDVLPASCPTPLEPVAWGEVENDLLDETSGLVQSELNPGVLWMQNDAGNDPVLYAVAEDGADLGTWTVDVEMDDWEDLALGWDDTLGGYAIYVGDIGDNEGERDTLTVLVVPEPTVDTGVVSEEEIADFSTLTLTYPDGRHNAESLLLDPVTGDLYIVTKNITGESEVFRKAAPHEDGTSTVLEHVADLTFGVDPLLGARTTTSGAFSLLGDRIAIRTYTSAYLWRRDQAFPVADTFAGEPCDLVPPVEPHGEAIVFTNDGAGYLTVSEGPHPTIWYTALE